MIISFEAQAAERAIATLWRWPPESDPTGVPEMLGMLMCSSPRWLRASWQHAPARDDSEEA